MIRPAAIVLGIAALVAAAGPAVAAAPTRGGVLVDRVTVDGAAAGQRLLDQQALVAAEDVEGRLVSAAALVELAGVPLDRLTELRVHYVGKPGTLELSRDEVVTGGATFDPEYNAQDVRFRGREDVSPATGTRLRVTLVTTAPLLAVAAAADRTQLDAGGAVHFTLTAPDVPAGTTYAWAFGDDAYEDTGAATTVDHVFAADGTYAATVTAQAPDGSAGVSGPVEIRVGTTRAPDEAPAGGAGSAAPVAPPAAELDTAGGGTGDRRAPTTGRDRAAGADAHARRGTRRARAAQTPAASSPSATTTDRGAPVGPAAIANDPAKPTAAADPPPSSPARPSRDPDAGPAGGAGPGTVRGLVLVGFHGEPFTADDPPPTERQDRAAARATDGDAEGGVTWLALPALLLLLALGAAGERLRRHRPRTSVHPAR